MIFSIKNLVILLFFVIFAFAFITNLKMKTKRIYSLCFLAAVIVAGNVMTSCSSSDGSDSGAVPFNPGSIQVTKSPDFNAYSGKKTLAGTTRSADVNGTCGIRIGSAPST